MKIKVSFFLMIILLLLSQIYKDNILSLATINNLELRKVAVDNSIEVKISYEGKQDEKLEKKKINNILSEYWSSSRKTYIAKDGQEIKTNVDTINKKTYVDIVYYDKDINSININKKVIKKMGAMANVNYSSTIKYKIQDKEWTKAYITQYFNKKLTNMKIIDYSGGTFGTGYIGDNKVTFAIAKYDTGSYLFIGSPVINMSY